MSRSIAVGIDIGTYQTKVVIAEADRNNERLVPRVIGVGYAESKGLRHGYIVSQSEVSKSISQAVAQAEKMSGIEVKRAIFSVGGIGLSGVTSSGMAVISRADYEITDLDLQKSIDASQSEIPQAQIANRRIIHTVPINFRIDGKQVFGNPVGMKGMRLESKTFFVTCLNHHYGDIIEAAAEADIGVEEIIASPMAASVVTLSKAQKIAGCVLCNIGSETVSIIVYEDNKPISLEIFPLGGNDITNDIALGLRIPLEEAEEVKKGSIVGVSYPRKKLDEIISARLSDIFELIEAHLKKIGKNNLLPAGIIITGGGSSIEMIENLAKNSLKLPSRIGTISFGEGAKGQIKDASWSVAYGLCLIGLTNNGDENGVNPLTGIGKGFVNWLKQFLP
ncbi:MAG: cell division protein FtsA [Candidatus Taylorbacteria bacterium RIFCSPLOWO2_02_FULL_43_11]|uniref:Cell division protein FtsA n=1 Tax=Candidatus Taylorbacteria bacterium RIFCSPHIGHO2_02_FULL_43_32b TaxID=1802306 RepID=A0A1G2MLX3_9BACT|nr:MAG: cell division protein FtsA [Candidatus Taylorbacteria bacterium RIFCSPHIGHO2_01_FULL_43_47]OHA24866.1 MAG: cell division protein FtsA [Candidatus Taylorbacteria bacterium RIFCSPHIGHO2_02_FULL_43_32b]OHA37386.1 MAG: cell division protein FtsA [Candidatus Taylorbacteria bacterium RIFCSPLOWO2_02_FULL_43_11]